LAQKSRRFPAIASTLFNALPHSSTLPVRDVPITQQNNRQDAGVERLQSQFWGMTPTPLANASPGRKRGVPGKEMIAIPARATQRGGAQSRKRL